MSLLYGSISKLPTPAPSVIVVPPSITGASKEIGVTLTRVTGSYSSGWAATANRWTINGTENQLGTGTTVNTALVSVGEYVLYRETISHATLGSQYAYSTPYGPFIDPPNTVVIITPPSITAPNKEVGVLMTRITGTFASGWAAISGQWTIYGTSTVIGTGVTCSSSPIPVGGYALFRELVDHATEPDQFAYSAPFGPFVATTPPPPPPPPPPPGSAGTLQAALRASMQKPPGREGRVLQAFYEGFTGNYPEFTNTEASDYTSQTFRNGLYGQYQTQWQPWLVMWEEATQPYNQPHVANVSNRKVATHVIDWYCGTHYSDTDEWVISGPVQYTDVPDMFDGRIQAFTSAGKFPTSQRVTHSDGTSGAILVNNSGITQAIDVRCQHSWWTKDDGSRNMVQIDQARYYQIDAVFCAIKARVDPVGTTLSGSVINGTAADVAASRILMWTGIDHYPFGSKPDPDALMAGRPIILTGEFRWHCSWVKVGSADQSWLDAHPVPNIT